MTLWLGAFAFFASGPIVGWLIGAWFGFWTGAEYAGEALADEEESIAALCGTLGCSRDELGDLIAESCLRIDGPPPERPEVTD